MAPANRTMTKLLLTATVLLTVAAGADADSWRIAIGGGRITGYVGTLASAGIHHEVLQDNQLLDGDTLALYDIVIVTPGVANPGGVAAAIEKYVAGGGIGVDPVGAGLGGDDEAGILFLERGF